MRNSYKIISDYYRSHPNEKNVRDAISLVRCNIHLVMVSITVNGYYRCDEYLYGDGRIKIKYSLN